MHSDFDFESLFGRSAAESETLLSACFAVCGPRGERKERDGDVSFVVSRRRFWPLSDEGGCHHDDTGIGIGELRSEKWLVRGWVKFVPALA